MEEVILVNERDEQAGTIGKLEAHKQALLHRAFSVFIFNNKGDMLLQQRAVNKYHSGGLWSNACCSHPRPGEETLPAAQRRLKEEMGFNTPLHKIFDFTYKTSFSNGLTEYEFDHVFAGHYEGEIVPNVMEVSNYTFKPMSEIEESLQLSPQKYTAWFHIAFPKIMEWWQNNK
ncbi:MAG TPA: isopentenyl-diphosphate Delta-isomerase [Chitinophagaceae bacterium]|jgi:isopentenyl-diphosphate delta-isomerase|nr:isopentenyl-diphosphate Delta-isomerase [Chitinophagaceae bacterium]